MLSLIAAAVASIASFIAVERRAAEPVLPLRLFQNRTFISAASTGFIVGFALFGSVTYMPMFLQSVLGSSPTHSGLQLVPMMGGMLVTSVTSGQLISKYGKYKRFPMVGTTVMTLALLLLSRLTPATTRTAIEFNMLLLGMGFGMIMQVLIIAVQNAVDFSDIGVATSGATLFRLMGGSVGTAVLGVVFSSRLERTLDSITSSGESPALNSLTPEKIAALEPGLRASFINAVAHATDTIFAVAAGVALVGIACVWMMPETPLRKTVATHAADIDEEVVEALGMPSSAEATDEHLISIRARASS
jgi:hypothetical protein